MPFDQMVWDDLYTEIGAGWYKNRFFYLFGRDLDRYSIILEDWSFALPSGNNYKVIGRNAYGALLLIENYLVKGFTAPIRLLDPITPILWGDDQMVLMNCIGHWLPNNKIPHFSDSKLYDAFLKITNTKHLETDEILAIKTPLALGGTLTADNFQIENIFDYYKSTAAIYVPLFKKK